MEITWKSKENFRVKIGNCFIQDETQNFNIDFNEIELKGEKCDKLCSAIENGIEKGQTLTLKLNSPNETYFRKGYFNNQVINTLVIPESSLQENSASQNPNNSSPSSDKYLYFLIVGVVILILLLFLFLFFLIKRQKSHKK